VAEGLLLLLFSGLQQQKNQISRRALAPVETSLIFTIQIKKRYLAQTAAGHDSKPQCDFNLSRLRDRSPTMDLHLPISWLDRKRLPLFTADRQL